MKISSKLVLLALLNLAFQNFTFGGGAEGHGGGDAQVATWYIKTVKAKSELKQLVQFPQNYQWTKVSKESLQLFKTYQNKLKSVLEKSKIFPMGSPYHYLSSDTCLSLSYTLFFEVNAYRCTRLEYSRADLVRQMGALLMGEIGVPEEEINAFSKDLEILIQLKRTELGPPEST